MHAARTTTGMGTKASDDLDWLFGCADSAIGVRSTFGAMIEALKIGHQAKSVGGRAPASTEHEALHHEATSIGCGRGPTQMSRMAAARKYGRVVRVFERLTPTHKRVLESWFYPRQYPIQVTAYFGRAAGVVPLCGSSVEADTSAQGLASLASSNSQRAQRLRDEANALYLEACKEYDREKAKAS